MKTFRLPLLLGVLAATLAFSSCKKDEAPNVNRDEIPQPGCDGVTIRDAIVLRFDYTNYVGEAPTLDIVPNETDKRVQYESTSYTPVQQGNKMSLRIPNLRLNDQNFNYIARCVTIEEFDETRPANDRWFEQTEFKSQDEFSSTKLAVHLSLDVSSSLGEDREKVKQYAIEFAGQVLDNSGGNRYVGLTLFADTVVTYPFTNQLSGVINAINSFPYPDLDAQTFTRLSDGIIAGLEALEATDLDVDDKVLVAFTDGNDNGSNNPSGNEQRILSSSIPRYMIGLKGKGLEYNSNYLKDLATNDRYFVEATDATELQKRFNNINELIANIYTVIYNRSTQAFDPDLDKPIKLRAIFYATPYRIDQN